MLYTKIQLQSLFDSGEEDFSVFLPYMGMAAVLLDVAGHVNKLAIPFWQRVPCEIW